MSEESIRTKVVRNEKEIEASQKRIAMLERDQWNLSKDSQRLAEILTDLRSIVDKLNEAITIMQMKPARDMESYKMYTITTIIGIVIAFIVGKYL